jgi:hypothetical protein
VSWGLDFALPSPEEWWSQMAASMDGLALRRLTPRQAMVFEQELMSDLTEYARGRELRVEVPVNFAIGWKS